MKAASLPVQVDWEKLLFPFIYLSSIVAGHDDLWHLISNFFPRSSDINVLLNNIQHMLTSNEDLNIFPCTFYFNIVIMSRGAGSSVRILNISENSITKKY
ncbi:unnamed protein product [Tenebrio molitor]|nr:unnamed protein product [Tenebrio molitor]